MKKFAAGLVLLIAISAVVPAFAQKSQVIYHDQAQKQERKLQKKQQKAYKKALKQQKKLWKKQSKQAKKDSKTWKHSRI